MKYSDFAFYKICLPGVAVVLHILPPLTRRMTGFWDIARHVQVSGGCCGRVLECLGEMGSV